MLCILAFSAAATVLFFAFPDVAAAAEDPETNEILNAINGIATYFLQLSSALLWPVLLMIGSLLDNDLIFGGAMGERLLGIWVQIRNLVNIAFVLVLLAVAVYNVLGIGEEGGPFALKQVLPKFVLALIAVNFSFLAIKVVLDFTNVLTGAVFALPATSGVDFKRDEIQNIICGTSSEGMPMRPLWCKDKVFNERAKAMFARLDRNNITLVYAIKFGKAAHMKFIRDGLKGLGQLGFNIIFNLVLYFVYALSFIALFLVLLGRVVALWIAVVLSPLLALSIVVPQLKDLAGGAGEFQQKFVKSAIAPITIGLVLSVGYIMLDGFSLDKSIHGSILSSSTLEAIDPNSLPTEITDLQQLMVAVGVVVIVWVGVFGAAKGTVAEAATNFIESKALDFGKFAAKLPTLFQMIPVSGKAQKIFGPKASLAELGGFMGGLKEGAMEKWGGQKARTGARQLLGLSVISEEQTAAWKGAMSTGTRKDIAQALAKHGGALQTQEGWSYLRDAMMKNDKNLTAEKFASQYGSGPDDIAKAAKALWNGPLKGELQAAGITSENKLAEAMRQSLRTVAEKIDSKESAAKAIGDEGEGVLKTHKNEFTVLNADQLRKLQPLPKELRESLIEFTKDNKVQLVNNGGVKLDALAILSTALNSRTAAQQITDAITAAKSNLTHDQIKQLIDASSAGAPIKDAATAANNPQTTATTSAPPPAGITGGP